MVAVQASGTSAVYNPFARGAAVKDLSFTASPSDFGQKGKTDTVTSEWVNGGQSSVQSITPRISAASMGTLLQQQDSRVNKWNDAPTEPPRFASGGERAHGVGYYLTTGEKEMFTAITGYTFDALGATIGPDGEPGISSAHKIMQQISFEREGGILKGPITAEYFKDMRSRLASRLKESGEEVDQAAVDKALDYLMKNLN
jgi:hypothetical protein